MKVEVLRNFKDLKENKFREVNEVFEATKERVEEINSTPHGALVEEVFVGLDLSNSEDMTVINGKIVENYKALTVNQIKELLDQMGIEYDSKLKKEELIELLQGGD